MNKNAATEGRKGLVIAIAASLVLVALAAYRVPLFHEELRGVIMGVSEVHKETGSKFVALVELETGAQVFVAIPGDFLVQQNLDVSVREGRSLFGRKSYTIIAYAE